jgi:hypothetical protein
MRRRIVSRGYEARPAPVVTHQPSKKDARNEPSSAPTRTTGSVIEVSLGTDKEQRIRRTKRVIDTEVEATVHNDAND